MVITLRLLKDVANLLRTEPEEGRYKLSTYTIEVKEEKTKRGVEGDAGWSVLASWIIEEISTDGFLGAICYGKLRAGKSIYTIKVAHDVLTRLGRHNDYEYIISSLLFFDVLELFKKLHTVTHNEKIPVMIWDDAGVYGSSYLWFTDKKLYMAIGRVLQVMATRLNSLLASTPKPEFILKPLRSVDNYIVYVRKKDSVYSKAIGYKIEYLPSGKLIVWKSFEDIFKRRIPPKAYRRYLKLRDSYVDITIDLLIKELEERRKRKQAEEEKEEDIEIEVLPPKNAISVRGRVE